MSEAKLEDRLAVLEWDVRVLKERLESLEAERKLQLSNTEREWLVGWTREAILAWQNHGNAESEKARQRMVEFFKNLERKLEAAP